jgi:release factor glutamine methyltransferase
MYDSAFHRGGALLDRHLTDDERPAEFTLLDRTWELMEGVFSPTYTPVTGLFSNWLPYPAGGTFLEVGSGTGVTAVMAALSGCRSVTALDISTAAVENTRRNVYRHGVQERVRVVQSDLFDALEAGERFDMIYWNSNFVEPPEDFVNASDLHHAFFDPGYEVHRRYVEESSRHLSDHGRLLLGFCGIGNLPLLIELCARAELTPVLLRSEERWLDAGTTLDFQLLELSHA